MWGGWNATPSEFQFLLHPRVPCRRTSLTSHSDSGWSAVHIHDVWCACVCAAKQAGRQTWSRATVAIWHPLTHPIGKQCPALQCVRSSAEKSNGSRPISKFKPQSAESVLGRGTTMERSVMNTSLFLLFFALLTAAAALAQARPAERVHSGVGRRSGRRSGCHPSRHTSEWSERVSKARAYQARHSFASVLCMRGPEAHQTPR